MRAHNVGVVFKRELSGSFRRLYAYLTIGVTLLVCGVLFFIESLSFTAESTLSVLADASLLVAVVMPITALNCFSYKKDKTDTDSVYDMMPLGASDILLGKYLAALTETYLPSLVICFVYPLIASLFSPVFDLGVCFAAAVSFLLFEAALLAVYCFICTLAKGRVRAALICYAVFILWNLSGILTVLIPTTPIASLISFCVLFLLIGALLWALTRSVLFSAALTVVAEAVCIALYVMDSSRFIALFERAVDKLSVFERFDIAVYGVLDIEALIYFLSVTALFLFLAFRRYTQRYERPRKEGLRVSRVTSMMLAICLCFATLGVNAVASAVPDRVFSLDVTKAGKMSVSREARDYLATLDKDVTLYLLEPTGFDKSYELYLENFAESGDRVTLERVYYDSDPAFYGKLTERLGITKDTVSANSLVIACGDNMQYLSYYDMFTYSNETLGFVDILTNEYNYYYQMFSQSEDYAQYLYAIVYDTYMSFTGDRSICSVIEYVTADIIPSRYLLMGHGGVSSDSTDSVYYGIPPIDLSVDDVPEDAACILINLPDSDLTASERDKMLNYLERGGQLTFITDEAIFDMPNFLSVLAAYGMSASRDFVSIETETDGKTESTTTLTPAFDCDNDILYALDGKDIPISVTDANAIVRDATVREKLVHYPLVVLDEGGETDEETPTVTKKYILACAAEDTDTGAHIAWFTGGESYNDKQNLAYAAPVYALSWVNMEFVSVTENIPSVIYQNVMSEITSGGATAIGFLLIILPVALMVFGGIAVYKRKKAK